MRQHDQGASICIFTTWISVRHTGNIGKGDISPPIVYPIGDTSIDGDPAIKELWQPFKIDGEPVTGIPGNSRTVIH